MGYYYLIKKGIPMDGDLERYQLLMRRFNELRKANPNQARMSEQEVALFEEMLKLAKKIQVPVPENWPNLPEYSGDDM